jgi:endonuclease/exonuclease/phosphatase family metal-dependent hydrolase
MRIITWNTEWRKTSSSDAGVIRARLEELAPDIVCLTETHADFLADWPGYTVCGTDNWGGPTFGTRREVLLWSKRPWHDLDQLGSSDLPAGRFVQAVTDTPLGRTTVVGIVIPYHMSNVRTGLRNRSLWELHRLYLDALPKVTASLESASIVLGDFNQRIPSKWVPHTLREKRRIAFSDLDIVTRGKLPPLDEAAIDHIAIGSAFIAEEVRAISNLHLNKKISDHFGVSTKLALNSLRSSDPAPAVAVPN